MSRVPAIRFKGFTDPWEQRKLGEVASLLGGNAWSSKEYDPSGDYLVITIANVTGEYEVDDSEGNRINVNGNFEYLLSHGDILVSLTGNVGRVSRMTSTKAVLNQRVGKLSVDCDIDDEFIFQAIRDGRFLTTMETASQGAAQKNISNSDVLSFELLLPTLKEQQVVGEALHRIDTLITLHQRKYDKLCTVKKSMLDKMFPKPGEFVPEIRFEGFTDPWEQRKLGEVASLLGGNAWSSKEYDPSGDYLVITIANVTGEYEVDDSEGNRINVNGNFEYLLSHGDILVSLTGNVGRVSRMTSTKAVLNQRVGKLSVDCDIDDEFIFQAIRDGRFLTTMETASQGAAQKNISNSDVLSFELLLPTLKEQQVVGEALHRIDTLITLHQRKLELLKNIKKSLLDKMFV